MTDFAGCHDRDIVTVAESKSMHLLQGYSFDPLKSQSMPASSIYDELTKVRDWEDTDVQADFAMSASNTA
jgi:hypothetical protein